jgi:tetratricopeptide (TPR) repeat protein
LLFSLLALHRFYPPKLKALEEGALKAAYLQEKSYCSAKAKAAYASSTEDKITLKTYCGILGKWKTCSQKEIPLKHLETEFSSLQLSDYLAQADGAIAEKNYSATTTALEKALYLDDENAQLHARLGSIYHALNDKDSARDSSLKALQFNPDDAQAHLTLGLIYSEEKNDEEAYAHLTKNVFLQPSAISLAALGETELRLGKTEEAIFHLHGAIDTGSRELFVFTQLGAIYWERKHYSQASALFREAYAIAPQSSVHFLNYYEVSLLSLKPPKLLEKKAFVSAFKTDKKVMMLYEMLEIIELSIAQKEVRTSLQEWNKNYAEKKLDWSFSQLFEWLDTANLSDDAKQHIKKSVGFFIGHQQIYNLQRQKGF